MSQDARQVKSKVRGALDKIGKVNGTALPDGASNTDAIMHELYVAAEGAKYFEDRYEKAKKAALELDAALVDKLVAGVKKHDSGDNAVLADGNHYTVTLSVNKPAYRLDMTKFRNLLVTEFDMELSELEQAETECKVASEPAKRLLVSVR